MIPYTKVNTDGSTITGWCSTDQLEHQLLKPSQSMLEGIYPDSEYFFNDGLPILKGEAPSLDHKWDATEKKWFLDIGRAKTLKKKAVDQLRTALNNGVISYDGEKIQADAEAIKNIDSKIQKIVAAESLGATVSPMIWRNADNITHTWESLSVYKAWLQGLIMAIDSRNTAIYVAAWQHKALIDGMDSAQDIQDYDITSNWL